MKTKAAVGALVAIVVIGALLLSNSYTGPAADLSSTPGNVRLPAADLTSTPGDVRLPAPPPAQPKNPPAEATSMMPQPLPTASAISITSPTTREASPAATAPQQLLTLELSTPQPGSVATPLSPASSAPEPTEGVIGEPPTPPGRLAPDAVAGPLQLQQIRIFRNDSTGTFAGRANMTNTGPQFLNGLVVSWQIRDGADQILDRGQFNWPNLAPGETATVSFDGSATFVDSWARVNFEFTP